MGPSREIEKLQRRWQENPLGLTFAPLAEAYRKEGMLADALELLEIGLSQHPSYVPAHIVKGRCFLDTQSDGEAERAFLRVTDLDPENVIALKGLADVAERGGRYDSAIGRLERLLEFDRSNEDAQQQLSRLRAYEHVPTIEVATNAPPEPVPVVAPPPEVPPVAFQSESAPPVLEPAALEPPTSDLPRAEILDPSPAHLEVEVYSPVELTSAHQGDFQGAGDADALEPTEAQGGLAELSEGGIPTVNDDQAGVGVASSAEEVDAPSVEAVDSFVAELASMPETIEAIVEEDEPADEPDLVVTETMAEVFLRQGHRELALAVYSQLAPREPNNPRIRQAIQTLEAELRPPAGVTIPVFSAMLTGGQSVRGFFEQLLAKRRPGGAGPDDGLSLGAVFDDVATTAAGAAGTPQADPSFDEFYGDSPDLPSALPPTPARATAEPEGDDLDGFTDWLKGLRR